jgi:hypothetical protein
VQLLKAIKHLSMNPTLLDVLQNANAIDILVRVLDEQTSGSHSTVNVLRLILDITLKVTRRKYLITFSKRATTCVVLTNRARKKQHRLVL